MRTGKLFFTALYFSILIFGLGCTGNNPIVVNLDADVISTTKLVHHLSAVCNEAEGKVWFVIPQGWTEHPSEITVSVPDELPLTFESMQDGGFLYKFDGGPNWSAMVYWTDYTGVSHEDYVAATLPAENFERNIVPAGLYPNRIERVIHGIGVVNSGDDQIVWHTDETFQPTSTPFDLPPYSNPWELSVHQGSSIVTTLFSGVYTIGRTTLGDIYTHPVTTDGFRDFASANGVTIFPGYPDLAYVTNTNPVSYFPTEFGPGWVSCVEIDNDNGSVIAEIPTQWLNPQHVITDGDLVYVSCAGTIDFTPPDYIATALDNGGVHVIDPATNTIIKSYDLGKGGPGPMAVSPSGKYLYIGSGVAGWLFKIDLESGTVLNEASNPIVIDDYPGTFIPFVEISYSGLLATASFNTDTLYFMDSETGDMDPFPFFGPVELHPDDESAFYGPQDATFTRRGTETGLVVLTTVESSLHWLPL